ncbi:DUF2807 domain-containing protein [Phenylobacterium sp. LjRoot219]|uniref:GIN domain-containing protein n=1 Tax=Phenylobacterium sp. LjRoot219 TaxID=3342283 RepID=UPI003ECCDD8D
MVRALIVIIIAGFLTSVACISAAVAIGGPEAMARGVWSWGWDGVWDDDHGPHTWRSSTHDSGPQTQRDLPWSGDRLEVNAPAEIDYVQAPGPAKLTIRAPAHTLNRVRVEGGRITLPNGGPRGAKLHITLTAPAVTRFELNGADELSITGYQQDELTLVANGHAEIKAAGQTQTVRLSVSGHGEADLADLKTTGADINISGAGEATVGPTDWARVQISGLGEVDLLTRPKRLETQIAGAGRVRQPDDQAASDGDIDDGRGPVRPT